MPTHNTRPARRRHHRIDGPNDPIIRPADGVDAVIRSLGHATTEATVVCFLEADDTIRSAIVVNGAAPDGDPSALIGAIREILLEGDIRRALVGVFKAASKIRVLRATLPREFALWTEAVPAFAAAGSEILDVLLIAGDGFVSWAECLAARAGLTPPIRYRE